MSLRVWLPLDGDLRNSGTYDQDIQMMGSGITWTAGKIGKAATFPNSCASCIHMPGLKLQIFSWAAWFKVLGEGSGTSQRMLSEGRDTGSVGTNIWVSKAGTTLNWSTHKKSGSVTIELNRWYHVVLTADGTNIKLYLDGVLKSTTSYTEDSDYAQSDNRFVLGKMSYAYANTGAYFPFNGQLNDVRIYDHCLSAAEIKEISQGLVLHYKLDGPMGGTNNNLLNGTLKKQAFVTTRNSRKTGQFENLSGGNGTVSIIEDNTVPIGKYAFSIQNNTSGNKDFGQYGGDMPFALIEGEKYTISAYYKGTGTSYLRIYDRTTGSQLNGKTTTLPSNAASEWVRISYTFTATSAMNTDNIGCLIGVNGASSVTMCGFKFEKGEQATEYCCSIWDLGIDETIIEDSSGYGHNCTQINVTNTNDTARYNYSSAFDGSSFISKSTSDIDIQTLTCWAKTTKNKSTAQMMVADQKSNMCLCFYSNSIISYFGNSSGAGIGSRSTLGSEYKENQWNFFAAVKTDDAGGRDVYCNGVKLTPTTNNYYSATCTFGIGNRSNGGNIPFYGQISDVRAYCTPLLDTDIKQLYNVGMKVDKNQNVHVFELQQNQQNKLYKTGILTMSNFYENDYKNILQYDQTIYTEPDGSTWAHIFHHNNPANARFTNGAGDWSEGVYLDADRWYDVEKILNNLVQYEFLVKQKTTDTASETKWRWIQNINPLDATWETVGTDACIHNTSSGYSVSNYKKGMYIFKTSSLHMCIANNSKGNWYGGIGACSVYQNGIPGYPNTAVTTGYIDLYVRIYPNTSILKYFGFSANQFIEM